MWRCFCLGCRLDYSRMIFSTYVEVFLSISRLVVLCLNFLHVCGGVSNEIIRENYDTSFSPRMWRCFRFTAWWQIGRVIFSTYVEVFPRRTSLRRAIQHFLHVCGGVSGLRESWKCPYKFSPRMWRCFQAGVSFIYRSLIFSTYVEVFLAF